MNEPGEEQKSAGLAELLRGLAHDMRTPLMPVSHALTEIGEELQGQLSDSQRQILALAARGLRRLERMADRLSLVSSLESGSYALHPRELDLATLIREVIAYAKSLESRREVTIEFEPPEGSLRLEGDSTLLTAALVELTINGVLNARRRVRVQLAHEGAEARISFEDDGLGVRPDQREGLFGRFLTRVPRTRSGLGLGLSIAHDGITAHGGRLSLEDSTLPPGRPNTRGARFVAALPIKGGA